MPKTVIRGRLQSCAILLEAQIIEPAQQQKVPLQALAQARSGGCAYMAK